MVEMEPDPPVASPASASTNGSGIEEDPSEPKASHPTRRSRLSVASFPRGFFSSLRRRKVKSADSTAQDAAEQPEAAAAPPEEPAASSTARKSRSLSLGSFRFRRNVNRPKSAIESEPPTKGKAHKDRRSVPALSPSTPADQEAAVASTSDAAVEDKPVDVPAKEEVVISQATEKKKTKKGKTAAAKSEGSSDVASGVVHSKDVAQSEETPAASSAAAKNTKGKAKSKSSSAESPAVAPPSPRDPVSEATTADESPAVNEQPVKSKGRITSAGRDFFSSFRRKKTKSRPSEEASAAASASAGETETAEGTMKSSRSLSLNSLRLKKGAKTQSKDKATQSVASKMPVSLVSLVDVGSSQTDLPAGPSSEATASPSAEENAPPTPKEENAATEAVASDEAVASAAAEAAAAQKEKPRERFLFSSLRRKKKVPSIDIQVKEGGQTEASANEAPLLTPQPEPKPSADKKFGRSFSFNSFRLKKKANKSNELKAPENSIDKSTSAVTLVSMEEAESKPSESANPTPANRSPHVKFKGEPSEAAEGAKTPADATDGEAAVAERASTPANDGKAPKEEPAKASAAAPVAENTALLFLKGIIDGPQKQSAAKVLKRKAEEAAAAAASLSSAVSVDNVQLNQAVLGHLRSCPVRPPEWSQLEEILSSPHFQSLLNTHDTIGENQHKRSSQTTEGSDVSADPSAINSYLEEAMPADISAVRVVGLRKSPGEPLGLTVKTEDGQLVVARILGGGAVDRQGLLHVGDVIGEVNGVPVRTAEQLQVEIARCKEHIQLKVLPSCHDNGSPGAQVGQSASVILASETVTQSVSYVRAHFDYDPKEDKLLPCPEIGLAFKKGDILQVVNQSDPNWWQAKKVGWSGPAGLIPSQELEERRKAFVAPEADFVHKIGFCGTRISKKKKKLMYQIKSSVDLDKAELLLYEEVTRMPPFRRKTLVLIGSEGVGRRTLKNRLINSDPDRFGTTLPHTSRPMRELEEDGMGYWFVSREEMEHDIRDHQFLECGEHNGHLYGTKLDSIRAIIRQGKMCVLDCSPNALKILHNSPEFMPFVIFLAAPGMDQLKGLYENSRYSSRNLAEEDFKNALEESARIQRTYEKYFDQIVINEDPDATFRKVVESLEVLSNQHQWVPVSWVY